MKCLQIAVLCFLVVFGFSGEASGKIPPCSTPAVINGPDTLCAGTTITVSDITTGGTWSSSNTLIATIGSLNGMIAGVSGGTATITYMVAGGCDVKPILPINGTMQICVGSSGMFSDLSVGGTWTSSNTTVATINSSTGAEDGIASGSSMITYTIPNGCSMRVLATVNPLPVNNYVFGGGYFCAGTPGATIGLDGSDTGINYLLYNGTTLVDSQYGNGNALYYGPYATAGTYQIYGVNIVTGCLNRMSGEAIIGVIPDNVPFVSISTAVGDTVCIAASTTFTATPVNAGGSPTFQWYVNYASVGTGNTYNYTPLNGDVVQVVVYSDAVCAIPSTATGTMTMTTIPSVWPSVSISVVPGDTVCEYVPVTIVPSPVYGGPSPIYKWTKNGIVSATGPVYHYLPVSGDNIFCSIYSDYECLIADSAYSNNVNVTVVPLLIPTVTVTAQPGDTLQEGQKDTLIAHVVNGGTLLSYQWEINGVAVPGATLDTFISSSFSGIDTVTCVVSSASFCGGEPVSAFVVIRDTDTVSHVGIAMVRLSPGGLSVLPNPNKGVFTVNGMFASTTNEVSIEIMDIMGQTVYKRIYPVQNGSLKTQIELREEVANGVYVIHFSADGISGFSKVVLNR